MRAFVAAVVLLFGGMMLQSQAARAGAAGVSIQNFQFAPAAMTLTAGDAVTWTNHDPTTHSVRWTGGRTDAGPFLSQGQTYTTSFAAPGSYTYVCGVHPSMMGSVTVMAVPTPTPTHSPAPPPTPASSTPRPTTRPTPSPTQQPTARSSPTESQAPATISFAPAISSTPATVVEIATSSPATTVPAPVAAAPPAPPSAPANDPVVPAIVLAVGGALVIGAAGWRFARRRDRATRN